MKASEIIGQYSQSQGIPAQSAIAAANEAVSSGNSVLLQENDTVLVVTKIKPTVADVAMFTADSPQVLQQSLMALLNKLRQSGIQMIYGDLENKDLVSLLQQSGMQLSQSDLPNYACRTTI
jgi:hypothetical protein